MSEEKQLVAGRYRLDELIGRGPGGEVWRAHDENADWTVAVKMLTAGAGDQAHAHAQAVAKVVHPNVAMVLDIGGHDGVPYLVMEFLTGQSLGEERAAHGPLGIVEACDLFGQAASGLDAAHRAGVVHGDVDPGCFRRSGSGVLKVVGFGIPGGHQAGRVTPYTAPEQLDGDGGPAADLYALGAVCYEMLCGRPPFEGSGEELAGRIRAEAPEPPTRHRPAIPAELEQLLLALLVKDPAARPASGEAVRRRLASIARPGATQRTSPLPSLGNPGLGNPGLEGQGHGSPGPDTAGFESPGPHNNGLPGNGLQSSGLHSSGPHSSGLQSSGPHSSGPHSKGPHSSGLQVNGLPSAGPGNPDAQGTAQIPATGAHLPGGPPGGHDGHTAVYDLLEEEPPNQNRRLIIQLVAAVAVIALVTIGFVVLSGRDRPEAAPAVTTTPPPSATPDPTQPATTAPTPKRPSNTPSPGDVVQSFGPDTPLDEPKPRDTTGLTQTPPGGWTTWLSRFDEAVRLQQQVNGIDGEVAAHARKKIAKAVERARRGRDDQARRHALEAAKDLVEATGDGEMSPSGPLADFLRDWGLMKGTRSGVGLSPGTSG
ncbi:serine/threonine protein kinase [Nonomuraea typhae]|uniref:serine/threonine protein kinase n=1 Tax=Nonomuraea typhae TaxID=2603600 RepID=UPI0012F732E3|nr:serine/threonine-protein kinase [Nonomuraea typhae]